MHGSWTKPSTRGTCLAGSLKQDETIAQQQSRTFRWNGTAFTQTDGPTGFPPNPRLVDLTVTAASLAFGPATGPGP